MKHQRSQTYTSRGRPHPLHPMAHGFQAVQPSEGIHSTGLSGEKAFGHNGIGDTKKDIKPPVWSRTRAITIIVTWTVPSITLLISRWNVCIQGQWANVQLLFVLLYLGKSLQRQRSLPMFKALFTRWWERREGYNGNCWADRMLVCMGRSYIQEWM